MTINKKALQTIQFVQNVYVTETHEEPHNTIF